MESDRWGASGWLGTRGDRSPSPPFALFRRDEPPASHPLAAPPEVDFGLWVCKTRGTLAVRDEGSAPGRNPSVIRLLREVQARYPELDDFDPVFLCTEGFLETCSMGAPSHRVPGDDALAIHALASRPQDDQGLRLHLVPDNSFDHWSLVGIHDFDEVCEAMREAGEEPPALPVAGWIGNIGTHPVRAALVNMSSNYPDLLEALDSGQWQASAADGELLKTEHNVYLSMPGLVERYAYLIDVAGKYSSFRLKYLLHSGRPVLLQERPYVEFWSDRVRPWEHFVPVAHNLSDLVERVTWLRSNPKEAEAIAHRARRFAQRHLTRHAAVDRYAHVLAAVAARQRGEATAAFTSPQH